jgi:ribosome biogenesis GTPase A
MGFWPAVMQTIKNADIVIFILDARLPEISRNTDLEKKLKESKKRFLTVFNKIDLISQAKLRKLQIENKGSFFVSTLTKKGMNNLRFELQKLTKALKLNVLEVGVVGYPNVGKSALTNILTRASKAKVSSKAGTTTGLQWISGVKIKVLDSPGVIPFEDDEVKLGILGAKNPEKLKDPEKVAIKIIELCLENSTENLQVLYKIKILEGDDPYDLFNKIGESRNLLLKGGIIDELRCSLTIIKDWQKGKLLLD